MTDTELLDIIDEMIGPLVAWATVCAKQAGLPDGQFNPAHQDLMERASKALQMARGSSQNG